MIDNYRGKTEIFGIFNFINARNTAVYRNDKLATVGRNLFKRVGIESVTVFKSVRNVMINACADMRQELIHDQSRSDSVDIVIAVNHYLFLIFYVVDYDSGSLFRIFQQKRIGQRLDLSLKEHARSFDLVDSAVHKDSRNSL